MRITEKKIVVITGSTRGIGYGLADALLERGCTVVVSGRTEGSMQKALESLSARYGNQDSAGFPCNVASYAEVEALWQAAKDRFGRVDIWINNAGIANTLMPFWELPSPEIEAVVTTNVLGVMNGSRIALQGMLEQGFGSLYNMEGLSSGGGRMMNGLAVYGATKAGLKYFNKALAQEVKGTPIIVGAIRPGMVATDMLSRQYEGREEEWKRVLPIFNLLAERVETVAPWLADKILANTRNGAVISYSSPWRLLSRFLMAPFRKREVFPT